MYHILLSLFSHYGRKIAGLHCNCEYDNRPNELSYLCGTHVEFSLELVMDIFGMIEGSIIEGNGHFLATKV